MGMSVGKKKGGAMAEMNIVPLIDVLLVLLVIFMVIQQSMQKGISVQVPPVRETTAEAAGASPDQIVLEVRSGRQYYLNQQHVPAQNLQARLTEVYAPRPRKVIFVKADEDVTFGDVVFAVDTAKGSGIEVVGLIPRPGT
jgi:biopolymer transport protein TolR